MERLLHHYLNTGAYALNVGVEVVQALSRGGWAASLVLRMGPLGLAGGGAMRTGQRPPFSITPPSIQRERDRLSRPAASLGPAGLLESSNRICNSASSSIVCVTNFGHVSLTTNAI